MMRTKWAAIAAAVVLVGWLSLITFAGGPPAAVPATAGGRYQMVVSPIPNNDAVYVIDTQTGQVWWRQHLVITKWTDWGSPAARAKK
jgi:hypothetical protein